MDSLLCKPCKSLEEIALQEEQILQKLQKKDRQTCHICSLYNTVIIVNNLRQHIRQHHEMNAERLGLYDNPDKEFHLCKLCGIYDTNKHFHCMNKLCRNKTPGTLGFSYFFFNEKDLDAHNNDHSFDYELLKLEENCSDDECKNNRCYKNHQDLCFCKFEKSDWKRCGDPTCKHLHLTERPLMLYGIDSISNENTEYEILCTYERSPNTLCTDQKCIYSHFPERTEMIGYKSITHGKGGKCGKGGKGGKGKGKGKGKGSKGGKAVKM